MTLAPQLLVASLSLLNVRQGGARPPQTIDQIPIYPAATRDRAAEADWEHEQRDQKQREAGVRPGGVAIRTGVSTFRSYRVKAPVDDVVKYYRQQLGAREVTESQAEELRDETGSLRAAVGSPSPLILQITPVDFESFAGEGSGVDRAALARAVKALYTRLRQPYRAGVWLTSAEFEWVHRAANDRTTSFTLSVRDEGLPDVASNTLVNETSISITIDDATDPGDELPAMRAPADKPPFREPSAAELGVPRYPSATYDQRTSGGMSSDEERYFIYTSTDAPERVAAFYASRSGKKALRTEGGWLFQEIGLTVQPNAGTHPATVKTVITIRKEARP